jgi:hypothetical protein
MYEIAMLPTVKMRIKITWLYHMSLKNNNISI